MQENISPLQPPNKNNRMLLIISATLFVLILAIVGYMAVKYQSSSQQKQAANQAVSPTGVDANNPMAKQNFTVSPNPTVQFTNWILQNNAVTSPSAPTVYYFKQAYSYDDAQALAQKLNTAGTIKQDKNLVIAYTNNINTTKELSLMAFNTSNGTFSYSSSKGIALTKVGTTSDSIYQFLKNANLYDPTLKVAATYKKKTDAGITYYELHRDWAAAGYPILSTMGLLNVPEKQMLSTLTLNTMLPDMITDSSVVSASDGKNGYARQTDFNTITVGITDATGNITSIKSNMRLVQSTGQLSNVVSYEDAVSKLKAGQYEFLMTTPSGSGDTPWEQIYPNNIAQAENAVVTDSIIAYLENPPATAQTTLTPSYIFKGYANLKSGYRVSFVAAVSLSATAPQAKTGFSLVHDVLAQDTPNTDKGQKQSTFDASQSTGTGIDPTNTNGNNTGVGSDTTTSAGQGACRPSSLDLNPIYQIPAGTGLKYGWANWRVWQGKQSTSKQGFWYYIPEANISDSIVRSNLNSIIAQLEGLGGGTAATVTTAPTAPDNGNPQSPSDDTTQKQGTFSVPSPTTSQTAQNITTQELTIRQQNKILQDILSIPEQCPIRLTGASPSLFVYGTEGSRVAITPQTALTYADPGTNANGSWDVQIMSSGVKANGLDRGYIYYEYAKLPFTRPQTGWVINKKDIAGYAKETAAKLKLTSAETDRLAAEIDHASQSIKSDKLFVGLVGQSEVNALLPLRVSPMPEDVYRFHFYVSSATEGQRVSAPVLTPVVRSQYMILEIGAFSAK